MSATRVIKSQRGCIQIVYNSFIYKKKKKQTTNKIRWICSEKNCFLSATSSNIEENYISTFYPKEGPHQHQNSDAKLLKNQIIANMKEILIKTDRPCRSVVFKALEGSGIEEISHFPNFESTYKLLRRFRNTIKNPTPHTYPILGIGDRLSKTILNEAFYRAGPDLIDDTVYNPEILIFYSDLASNNLRNNSTWCIDGTFSVVPKPYYQLVTIGYIKDNIVFPAIFSILPDKKKQTYEDLFRTIISKLGNISPIYIKTDFESAIWTTAQEFFPESLVSGCQFHLGQAIQRHISSIKLIKTYRGDKKFKLFAKCLSALSYVNPLYVIPLFNGLRVHNDFPPLLSPVYEYFRRNFIQGIDETRFPIDIWNCYHSFLTDNTIRTNNAIEGWHSVLKSTFLGSRSSLILLLDKLRYEEDAIRIRAIKKELGHKFHRKHKYVAMEEKVIQFFNDHVICGGDVDLLIEFAKLLFY